MALPWIKLHTNIREHDKSDELGELLDDPRAWTYAVELWLWCATTRPDGDLTGLSAKRIAKRSGWAGDADEFFDAMVAAGFIEENDERMRLSGWEKHQGAHKRKFERDRKRRKNGGENDAPAEPARMSRGTRAEPAGERRGEERRGDKTNTDVGLATDSPALLEPETKTREFSLREIAEGALDHLAPKTAWADRRVREAVCEAHRIAWGLKRCTPKAKAQRDAFREFERAAIKPSEALYAVRGMRRDPWEGRSQHNGLKYVAREVEKWLGLAGVVKANDFDDPEKQKSDEAAWLAESLADWESGFSEPAPTDGEKVPENESGAADGASWMDSIEAAANAAGGG